MAFAENNTALPVALPPQPQLDQPHKIVKVEGRLAPVIQWKIARNQDEMIFDPHPKGWEKLRDPSTYDEFILKPADPEKGTAAVRMNVTQRTLVTEGSAKSPSATITLWEKKAEPGKEHYIFFTGRRGDIADMGPLKKGLNLEDYDRHAGLEFLKSLGAEGAGFTVVTMRGYGNNKGTPSEEGFRRDIDAFVKDWLYRSKREGTQVKKTTPYHGDYLTQYEDANTMPYDNRTIVAGISLGTGNAAILAAKLTERGHPPAMLALVNPYRSLADAGSHALKQLPAFYPQKFKVGYDYPVNKLSEVLKHKLETHKRFAELSKDTHVLIVTSGKDRVIPASNSTALVDAAKAAGLNVHQELFEQCDHYNIPADALVQSLRNSYERVQAEQSGLNREDRSAIVRRLENMRDGVYTPDIPQVVDLSNLNTPSHAEAALDRLTHAKDRLGLTRRLPQTKSLEEALPVAWLAGGTKKELVLSGDEMPHAKTTMRLEDGRMLVATVKRWSKPRAEVSRERVCFNTDSAISCSLGSKPYGSYSISARYNGAMAGSDSPERG